MPRIRKRGKRVHSSTSSDFESNTSALDQTIPPLSPSPSTKEKKNKNKKQRKMDEFVKGAQNKECAGADIGDEADKMTSIEKKLDNISKTLAEVLTKSDRKFIKEIIISTVNEMKEQFLKSVNKKIEALESEVNEAMLQTERQKKDLQKKDKQIDSLKAENEQLKSNLKAEEKARQKEQNDLEQHGRRNSIRIKGILNDADKQPSETVSRLVVKTLNGKSNLNLKETDIDISHRLGRWSRGSDRPVIVKFVRRQTKIDVMRSAKSLRGNGVFVNEDLTWLNQQVLSSLRLKDPNNIIKSWSFEGKLFAIYKDSTRPTEVKFNEYEKWLSKPWPAK